MTPMCPGIFEGIMKKDFIITILKHFQNSFNTSKTKTTQKIPGKEN